MYAPRSLGLYAVLVAGALGCGKEPITSPLEDKVVSAQTVNSAGSKGSEDLDMLNAEESFRMFTQAVKRLDELNIKKYSTNELSQGFLNRVAELRSEHGESFGQLWKEEFGDNDYQIKKKERIDKTKVKISYDVFRDGKKVGDDEDLLLFTSEGWKMNDF